MTSELRSHWATGTWAPGETRLHWYLLPDDVPTSATSAVASRLREPGFDVVPPQWLHCTVVSLLPSLRVADRALLDQMIDWVRSGIGLCGPITARASLHAMGSALVWLLEPPHAFQEVFDLVVESSGSMLRTNRSRTYEPHLTVAYASAPHDRADVIEIVSDDSCRLPAVNFTRLSLLDVRQQDACYQWDVVETIMLGATKPAPMASR
jgi:hypothetical protein